MIPTTPRQSGGKLFYAVSHSYPKLKLKAMSFAPFKGIIPEKHLQLNSIGFHKSPHLGGLGGKNGKGKASTKVYFLEFRTRDCPESLFRLTERKAVEFIDQGDLLRA
jgi:hypothetical protein